jgi:hypothetical protein
MPKQLGEPVRRTHVLLFEADIATLERLYGQNPGVGPAVRIIVRQFLRQLDRRLESVQSETAEFPPA